AEPIEDSGPPAIAGNGDGAAHAPPHGWPYRSAPDFDRPAHGGPPEADGAAPEHTVPFPALTEEPERRRRFGLPRLRRPAERRPTRAGLMRKLPAILVVAGALLLLEGALTVLWKEPFSALFSSQVQSALGDDLEAREAEAAREAAKGRRNAVEYMRRRAVSLNRELQPGEPVGRLRVKKIDLSTVVVQSTTEPSLTKGPGHYRETPLPGQEGNWTVGIAGHRTTYDAPFRNIDKLERGDEIVFTLPYGRFTYEVEGTKVVDDSETGVFIPKGYDRIALTACHPLYSDAQRIIAYGKLKESKPRGGAAQAAAQS
ncbi:MAG: class E sortase, partial [Actinomycetota bacterium]|nr:class E sortase [Actinomycetota bacterium]